MQAELRRMFSGALVLGSALFIAFGWAVWSTVEGAGRAAQWVTHTREALDKVNDIALRSAVLEVSGQGPAGLSARTLRKSQEDSLRILIADARALGEITRDNASQQARVLALEKQAEGLILSNGQDAMTAGAIAPLKITLQSLRNEENRLLATRLQERDQYQQRTLSVIGLMGATCAGLLFWAWWGFRREAIGHARTDSRFRSLVQDLPVSVWLLRAVPGAPLKLEFTSDNAPSLRNFDIEAEDGGHAHAMGAIHPEDHDRVVSAMNETVRTLTPFDVHYRIPVAASVRWVHSHGQAHRDTDGSTLVTGYWQDVTREHELQDALAKATEEAKSANQAKSAFLAAMSHEIRTPMNGVLGLLELLSLTSLDAEQRSTLAVVRSSGESLLRIVDDILDFSRIEADRMTLNPSPASLRELVENTCQIYSSFASGKGVILQGNVDARLSAGLIFDRQRLGQVLNNLVSNALKFTERGSVTIEVKLVQRESGAERIQVIVADTGIGVAPADLERLFQPYSQARPDTASRFGGTGLGLVISRRLVELMGGTLSMASVPGEGTTMVLQCDFPVYEEDPTLPGLARAGQKPPGKAGVQVGRARSVAQAEKDGTLVLVADDHPTNRMVLKRQLNSLGYAAEAVADGRQAFDAWKSGRYRLVIADCNMPLMSGYELARSIREHEQSHRLRHTPIFACTANAMPSEVAVCRDAGMDEYIVKPTGIDVLAGHLERWLPLAPLQDPDEPVNRVMLHAVTGGDAAVQAELIREYRDAHLADVSDLAAAIARGDLPGGAQLVHRMRGACMAFGSLPLAEACGLLDTALRDGRAGAVNAALASVRSETDRLVHVLDAMLRSPDGNASATTGN